MKEDCQKQMHSESEKEFGIKSVTQYASDFANIHYIDFLYDDLNYPQYQLEQDSTYIFNESYNGSANENVDSYNNINQNISRRIKKVRDAIIGAFNHYMWNHPQANPAEVFLCVEGWVRFLSPPLSFIDFEKILQVNDKPSVKFVFDFITESQNFATSDQLQSALLALLQGQSLEQNVATYHKMKQTKNNKTASEFSDEQNDEILKFYDHLEQTQMTFQNQSFNQVPKQMGKSHYSPQKSQQREESGQLSDKTQKEMNLTHQAIFKLDTEKNDTELTQFQISNGADKDAVSHTISSITKIADQTGKLQQTSSTIRLSSQHNKVDLQSNNSGREQNISIQDMHKQLILDQHMYDQFSDDTSQYEPQKPLILEQSMHSINFKNQTHSLDNIASVLDESSNEEVAGYDFQAQENNIQFENNNEQLSEPRMTKISLNGIRDEDGPPSQPLIPENYINNSFIINNERIKTPNNIQTSTVDKQITPEVQNTVSTQAQPMVDIGTQDSDSKVSDSFLRPVKRSEVQNEQKPETTQKSPNLPAVRVQQKAKFTKNNQIQSEQQKIQDQLKQKTDQKSTPIQTKPQKKIQLQQTVQSSQPKLQVPTDRKINNHQPKLVQEITKQPDKVQVEAARRHVKPKLEVVDLDKKQIYLPVVNEKPRTAEKKVILKYQSRQQLASIDSSSTKKLKHVPSHTSLQLTPQKQTSFDNEPVHIKTINRSPSQQSFCSTCSAEDRKKSRTQLRNEQKEIKQKSRSSSQKKDKRLKTENIQKEDRNNSLGLNVHEQRKFKMRNRKSIDSRKSLRDIRKSMPSLQQVKNNQQILTNNFYSHPMTNTNKLQNVFLRQSAPFIPPSKPATQIGQITSKHQFSNMKRKQSSPIKQAPIDWGVEEHIQNQQWSSYETGAVDILESDETYVWRSTVQPITRQFDEMVNQSKGKKRRRKRTIEQNKQEQQTSVDAAEIHVCEHKPRLPQLPKVSNQQFVLPKVRHPSSEIYSEKLIFRQQPYHSNTDLEKEEKRTQRRYETIDDNIAPIPQRRRTVDQSQNGRSEIYNSSTGVLKLNKLGKLNQSPSTQAFPPINSQQSLPILRQQINYQEHQGFRSNKDPSSKLTYLFSHKGVNEDRLMHAKLNTFARVLNNYDVRKQVGKELNTAQNI